MVRLESENEEPQRNGRVEKQTHQVVIGPDDDDGDEDDPPEPKPEPPPKPKPKGLIEWIAGLCRRRWHKSASHS